MHRKPFIKLLFSLFILMAGLKLGLAEVTANPTVEFPAAIHFLNPAGDDIEVGPGVYQVETAESWLKLVPEGQGRTEAVLLEATPGTHEEKLEQLAIRLEEAPDNPDVFHLAMLLADGTGLEAIGTKSGIRPRGMYLSYLKRPSPKSSTRISRFGLARPKVGSGKQAPPPRPQSTCGPVRHWEVGINLGKSPGGTKIAQPKLAVFQNQMHLLIDYAFRPGFIDNLLLKIPEFSYDLHYVFNGTQWSKLGRAPGGNNFALAVYNRNLWAVWPDPDKQLMYSRYFNQWASPIKIQGQYSKSAPALAVRRGVLHMVHNGKSSDDLWHSTFAPRTQWTKNVKINRKSRTTPGFTLGTDGNLHMVYLGAAKRGRRDPKDLWYSQFNGRRWTTPYTIQNQFSKASPTLLGGAATTSPLLPVLMVHLGKSSNTLWHALYGKNPRLPAGNQQNRWHVNEKLLGKTSDGPVALTFFQGCIHMVYKVGKKLMHTKYSAKDVHSGLP